MTRSNTFAGCMAFMAGIALLNTTNLAAKPARRNAHRSGFLKWYVNPLRDTLPENRLYPMGQRMTLAFWHTHEDGVIDPATGKKETWRERVRMCYDHGCTAIGPTTGLYPYSSSQLSNIYTMALALNMRAIQVVRPQLGPGRAGAGKPLGPWDRFYKALDEGKTDEELLANHNYCRDTFFNTSPYKDIIDGFVQYPEEGDGHLSKDETATTSRYECAKRLRSSYETFHRTCIAGKKCFVWDTTGAQGLAWEATRPDHAKEDNMVLLSKTKQASHTQLYEEELFGGISRVSAGLDGIVMYTDRLNKSHPLQNMPPRKPGVLPGFIFHTLRNTDLAIRKYCDYFVWAAVTKGFGSLTFYMTYAVAKDYDWSKNSTTHKKAYGVDKLRLRKYYMDAVLMLTRHGFDKAFMWGKRYNETGPHALRFTDHGTTRFNDHYRTDNLVKADIQYENIRYIAVMCASNYGKFTVRISNLPANQGYRIINCIDEPPHSQGTALTRPTMDIPLSSEHDSTTSTYAIFKIVRKD